MLKDIEIFHSKINHDEIVKVRLTDGVSYGIGTSDLIKVTKTGMLRIIRANGRLITINPEYITAASIISTKGALL